MRSAAQRFGISKSTVHKDLSERLPAFNKPLYLQVKQVLDENKAEDVYKRQHPDSMRNPSRAMAGAAESPGDLIPARLMK